MKITNGDSILEVSAKAYEVIYKEHGYTEYVEVKKDEDKVPDEHEKPGKTKKTAEKKTGDQ